MDAGRTISRSPTVRARNTLHRSVHAAACAAVVMLGTPASGGAPTTGCQNPSSRACGQLLTEVTTLIGKILVISGSPGQYRPFATPQQAASAAGFPISVPTYSPEAWTSTTATLVTSRSMTVTATLPTLDAQMTALRSAVNPGGESESANPNVIQVTTTASSLVQVNYQAGSDFIYFAQAPTADVFVPASVNLPLLAVIRLILFGVNPIDAVQFGYAIDWRAAMLEPVPSSIASVHQYNVNGRAALLFQAKPGSGPYPYTLLWSAGGKLFGLTGNTGAAALLAVARSIT